MRRTVALLLASISMTGTACASSFVVVEPPKSGKSPSIIMLGNTPSIVVAEAPVAPKMALARPGSLTDRLLVPLSYPLPEVGVSRIQISASIIAFESPIPNVAYEKVAAITPDRPSKGHMPLSMPVVMRAGIIGDSMPRGSVPASAPVSNGSAGQSSAAASRSSTASKKSDRNTPVEPAPEPAIVVAPPPPTLPKLNGVN